MKFVAKLIFPALLLAFIQPSALSATGQQDVDPEHFDNQSVPQKPAVVAHSKASQGLRNQEAPRAQARTNPQPPARLRNSAESRQPKTNAPGTRTGTGKARSKPRATVQTTRNSKRKTGNAKPRASRQGRRRNSQARPREIRE